MGQIAEASQKYKDRVEAAGVDLTKGEDALHAAIERACAGLEIDLEEAAEVTAEAVPVLAFALSRGINPISVATSQWLEGYIVGRIDAEARLREEVVADD